MRKQVTYTITYTCQHTEVKQVSRLVLSKTPIAKTAKLEAYVPCSRCSQIAALHAVLVDPQATAETRATVAQLLETL